ncbi:MAG TPA: ribonuclease HII [bacterium]|nr:ribonuclease HII [bacterium]HPT29630.1 ribonuclease HII [bacterium]
MNLEKEAQLFSQGYKLIAGVDEAGRGPLAGPVVAAAVIFDSHFQIDSPELEKIKDSKKLSAKQRERLFTLIKEKAVAISIGTVGHGTIDNINILQATFLAMDKAVATLSVQPDYVLVDGKFTIPQSDKKQEAVIDGDAKVFSIAAASIIAKVSRDYLMAELHKKYPEYNFLQHKGYGTKSHLEALREFGPSPIHRRSFEPLKSWFPLQKKK